MSTQATYTHNTTAIPEITRQPVSTWSEEWQHECEARAVLAMSKAERNAFFNGSADQDGKKKERGIIAIRGPAAAEKLRSYMESLQEAHFARK